MCGDFNYSIIDWSLPSAPAHCEQLFHDTVQDTYLFQHVLEPTQPLPVYLILFSLMN